ncbi:MAG: putative membrane protein [Colwellia polaris]|jgi:putative membrane protein
MDTYLKGMAMGAADAVPGVSGGTIALITGIYERLIDAVAGLTGQKLIYTAKILDKDRQSFYRQLKDLEIPFLTVLGAGVLSSLLIVLNLMHYMISSFPVETYGFFFGLIAISALVLYSEVDLSSLRSKLAGLTGFMAAFLLSGYAATSIGNSLPVVFLSGAVAVSAMILPGISGSLILVILGQYEYMTAALSRFTDAVINIREAGVGNVAENAPPVVVFVSGGVVGLLSIAHLVKKALDKYRKATMTFLVSMIVGALRAPVEEVNVHLAEQGVEWITVLPEFISAAVLGGIMVFILDYRTLSDSIT